MPDKLIPTGQVVVCVAELDIDDDQWQSMASTLSADEIGRMERFLIPKVQRRFGVCRARLRQLLARISGTLPHQVAFEYNRHGKPRLHRKHRTGLQFNVSHSEGWAVFAFSNTGPVGIDVELFDRKTRYETLVSQILSDRENAQIAAWTNAERHAAIRRAWITKEAVFKAIGTGIAVGMQAVEFDLPLGEINIPKRIDPILLAKMDDDGTCSMNGWIDPSQWRVHLVTDFAFGEIAVACSPKVRSIELWNWEAAN